MLHICLYFMVVTHTSITRHTSDVFHDGVDGFPCRARMMARTAGTLYKEKLV